MTNSDAKLLTIKNLIPFWILDFDIFLMIMAITATGPLKSD